MFRGYRSILAALAGLALAGASPPQPDDTRKDQAAAGQIEPSLDESAPSLREANKSSPLDQPCEQGENKRSSDLCAQWKAAEAADSAAQAAWLFGSIGSLIGLLTLGAAAAAAIFAKKAADHTETGANAAAESVRANRAWLTPVEFNNGIVKDSMLDGNVIVDSLGFILKWKNTGATPALRAAIARVAKVVPDSMDTSTLILDIPDPTDEENHTVVGPGQSVSAGIVALTDEEAKKFRDGVVKLIIDYRAVYFDIYSANAKVPQRRETRMRYIVRHGGGSIVGADGVTREAISVQGGASSAS